jgi:hypothetical protein
MTVAEEAHGYQIKSLEAAKDGMTKQLADKEIEVRHKDQRPDVEAHLTRIPAHDA